jgi:hypothetical protein
VRTTEGGEAVRTTEGGEAVRTTEVRILDDNDLYEKLMDMRVWLDEHRYEPSTFTYFFHCPGMAVQVSFKSDDQAEAFARKFDGTVLHSVADSRIRVQPSTPGKPRGGGRPDEDAALPV